MIDVSEVLEHSKNLKVLYVEDNTNFADETVEILESFFEIVDFAKDGEEAFVKYKKFYKKNRKYYDIVITDIVMPNVSGLDLVKNIYEVNSTQSIIVLSAHNDADYLLEFVNLGIEHFMVKPFDLEEITNVIYKVTKKLNPLEDVVNLINNYSWDKKNLVLYYRDKQLSLTKKETLFVEILADNLQGITKIEAILKVLWPDSKNVSTNMLNPIISRLRKKLPQKLIKSVYGLGYKLYTVDEIEEDEK